MSFTQRRLPVPARQGPPSLADLERSTQNLVLGRQASAAMAPTLGQELRRQAPAESKAQGEGGRSEGGRGEVPSHSSFYMPLPVGGLAPPKTDERSQAIAQQAAQQGRRMRMSI